jgi:hypothetical protein
LIRPRLAGFEVTGDRSVKKMKICEYAGSVYEAIDAQAGAAGETRKGIKQDVEIAHGACPATPN